MSEICTKHGMQFWNAKMGDLKSNCPYCQLSATQAKRDTYRKALEEVHDAADLWYDLGLYEACDMAEGIMKIAREALKEDV